MQTALLSIAIAMSLLFGILVSSQVHTAFSRAPSDLPSDLASPSPGQGFPRYSTMAKRLADPDLKAEEHIQVVAKIIQ